jgi:hypothetical protein
LDALFRHLLGVTDEKPHGDHELTQKLHGMPVHQVEFELKEAGRRVLEHRITSSAVPRLGLWLANRMQRLLVWATVKVVVSYCTKAKRRDENVDLLALRASLAGEVDQLVVKKIRRGGMMMLLLAGLAASVIAWMLVSALQWLPP